MSAFIDLTGQTFGRLTVLSRAANRGRRTYWTCICSCGTRLEIERDNLKRGRQQSCGCLSDESKRARATHGMTRNTEKAPEYVSWEQMKQRVLNPNNQAFPNYGGRGITMCDSWRDSFSAFYADMGPKPTPKHSIERIDNNGNYELNNCVWATRKEQCLNRRSNVLLTFVGRTLTLSQWADYAQIPEETLRYRLRAGWSMERALSEPIHK